MMHIRELWLRVLLLVEQWRDELGSHWREPRGGVCEPPEVQRPPFGATLVSSVGVGAYCSLSGHAHMAVILREQWSVSEGTSWLDAQAGWCSGHRSGWFKAGPLSTTSFRKKCVRFWCHSVCLLCFLILQQLWRENLSRCNGCRGTAFQDRLIKAKWRLYLLCIRWVFEIIFVAWSFPHLPFTLNVLTFCFIEVLRNFWQSYLCLIPLNRGTCVLSYTALSHTTLHSSASSGITDCWMHPVDSFTGSLSFPFFIMDALSKPSKTSLFFPRPHTLKGPCQFRN